ncbi:MAG: AAA family ATPase [Leptolyngbyaceae cyanobacterium SU_3_3]|nr:AAA family ATPase [Leptolyngbyaceae cyanobacterium SU_3_3]
MSTLFSTRRYHLVYISSPLVLVNHCWLKAVADECKDAFIGVHAGGFLSRRNSESESRVRNLFENARKRRPCVLFYCMIRISARAYVQGFVCEADFGWIQRDFWSFDN